MPALRSEANITSDVWLCSAQPPWGMRPYGYLVSSCMPGHCLICEKVAPAIQSQYGSTRDKCWDVSLQHTCAVLPPGKIMVGPQIDGNSRVTIRTSTSNGPWPLISEWQERVTRSGWILAGRTKLSLSFPNGSASFCGLASTGTNGVLSLISEWQGEVTRSGQLPG